jgi:hypothetical protein
MIEIEGKEYAVNLDKLFEFVTKSSNQDKRDQEITDGYEVSSPNGQLTQTSKIVREIKSKGDQAHDSYRYDFVRILLTQIIEMEDPYLDFGDSVCFNTLIKYNILEEVKM